MSREVRDEVRKGACSIGTRIATKKTQAFAPNEIGYHQMRWDTTSGPNVWSDLLKDPFLKNPLWLLASEGLLEGKSRNTKTTRK